MPSNRVASPTVSLGLFDVVGQDGDAIGFIAHIGLADSPGSQDASAVTVFDMRPPLHGNAGLSRVRANAIGSAALTDDEQQKIKTFVDRHAIEHQAFQTISSRDLLRAIPQMYCAHPHMSPCNEDDGRFARMRFSCSGFVLEAYKRARIQLIDENALPMLTISAIRPSYAPYFRFIEMGFFTAEDIGLQGEGPWPVLLCGYLIHALNRDPDIIRQVSYVPQLDDAYFL